MKLLPVLILVLFLTAGASGQDCDHTSNSAGRFSHVRLLPPVRIRNTDLANLEYTHEDKHGIHIGKLTTSADTVMPEDLWKVYRSRWYWILYCSKCSHVYTIVEVLPEQLRQYKAVRPAKNRS